MVGIWARQLRPASFRGIPFRVNADTHAGGRRNKLYEFPTADEPFADDSLGRRARRYTVEGYVFGDDFARRRDALIRACETEGAGPLIHPRYGRLDVVCDSFRIRHSDDEGRMVRFDLVFVEAGRAGRPDILADTVAGVIVDAFNAADAAVDEFLSLYNFEGTPTFVLGSAQDLVANVSGWMVGIAAPFVTGGAVTQLQDFATNAASLAGQPAQLADSVRASMRSVFGLDEGSLLEGVAAGTAEDSSRYILTILGELSEYGTFTGGEDAGRVPITPPVDDSTPAGEAEKRNQDAFVQFITIMAAIAAAEAASAVPYEYIDQAIESADAVDERLAATGFSSTSRDTFERMDDLRRRFNLVVPSSDVDLPSLVVFTPEGPTQAILTAYALYGDALRDAEIVDRNNLVNPVFIRAGEALSVLSG